MSDNTEEIINKFDRFFADLRHCGFDDWDKIADTMDYVRKLRSGESTDKPMPLPKGFIEVGNSRRAGRTFISVAHISSFCGKNLVSHIWTDEADGGDAWLFSGSIDQLLAKIAEAQR